MHLKAINGKIDVILLVDVNMQTLYMNVKFVFFTGRNNPLVNMREPCNAVLQRDKECNGKLFIMIHIIDLSKLCIQIDRQNITYKCARKYAFMRLVTLHVASM